MSCWCREFNSRYFSLDLHDQDQGFFAIDFPCKSLLEVVDLTGSESGVSALIGFD